MKKLKACREVSSTTAGAFLLFLGALLGVSFAACSDPGFDDTDPGGEARFGTIFALDGYIHAQTTFYSSRDRYDTSGISHFDAERLIVGGERIQSPGRSDAPNLSHWRLGVDPGVIEHFSSEGYAVAHDSRGGLTVLRLNGIRQAAQTSRVSLELSASAGEPVQSELQSLGEDLFLVTLSTLSEGRFHETHYYSVTPEGELLLVATEKGRPGSNCKLSPLDRIYCTDIYMTYRQVHLIRVLEVDRAAGQVNLIGEATDLGPNLSETLAVRDYSFVNDDLLAVFGWPGTSPAVDLFDLSESGMPVFRGTMTLPGDVLVYGLQETSSSRALVAASDGVHLVDLSSLPEEGAEVPMNVLASYSDQPQRIVPFDPSRNLYMWALDRWGIVVVRVTDDGIETVSGYYRKFGDQFGTYTKVLEGKY